MRASESIEQGHLDVRIISFIDLPPLLRDLSRLRHWKQEELSRPDVGSSKNITGGLLTSSKAIDSLFR